MTILALDLIFQTHPFLLFVALISHLFQHFYIKVSPKNKSQTHFKMFSPFICGSFHHQEEEEYIEAWSPSSTPRKSRRNSLCRSKDSKNPYADRGLDKFSALLADLDYKRQKIYTQKGSEDISFVRFVYSNSNDFRPIVVKGREKRHDKTNVDSGIKNMPIKHNSEASDKNLMESSTTDNEVQEARMDVDQKSRKNISFAWNYTKLDNWRQPSYYLPVIVIVILLFLAVFGRTFTILCASLGWYLVPTIKGGISNSKSLNKKKYVRRLREVKIGGHDGIASPKSVLTRMNGSSPR